MTIVVCDSSILILISKLEILDILIEAYGVILIPEAVYIESVQAGKKLKKMDAFLIEKRINDKKIVIKKIKESSQKSSFINDFNIHEGEAEALLLYLGEKADLLGTDDYKTIKICKILNINYFTTLSFLFFCYTNNMITKEKAIVKYEKLKVIGWYKDHLIASFIKKIQNEET